MNSTDIHPNGCGLVKLATTMVAIASAVCFMGAPLAAQQNLGQEGTSWSWAGSVPSGAWLRLYTVNGPVRVTASPDGNAHVQAEKRVRNGGDPRTVHYAVVRDGNNVTICALWNDEATCDERGPRGNDIHSNGDDRRQNVEVNFQVQVPNGARAFTSTVNGDMTVSRLTSDVTARTVNGAVRVEQVGGPVNARSVNGDVRVDTRGGPVSAETVNGSINATMAAQGSADMRFRSVNGTIDINAPAQLNADVELSTVNGDIDSKFPLNYDRRRHHAEGTVGSGGPRLTATTVNGSVNLR